MLINSQFCNAIQIDIKISWSFRRAPQFTFHFCRWWQNIRFLLSITLSTLGLKNTKRPKLILVHFKYNKCNRFLNNWVQCCSERVPFISFRKTVHLSWEPAKLCRRYQDHSKKLQRAKLLFAECELQICFKRWWKKRQTNQPVNREKRLEWILESKRILCPPSFFTSRTRKCLLNRLITKNVKIIRTVHLKCKKTFYLKVKFKDDLWNLFLLISYNKILYNKINKSFTKISYLYLFKRSFHLNFYGLDVSSFYS